MQVVSRQEQEEKAEQEAKKRAEENKKNREERIEKNEEEAERNSEEPSEDIYVGDYDEKALEYYTYTDWWLHYIMGDIVVLQYPAKGDLNCVNTSVNVEGFYDWIIQNSCYSVEEFIKKINLNKVIPQDLQVTETDNESEYSFESRKYGEVIVQTDEYGCFLTYNDGKNRLNYYITESIHGKAVRAEICIEK